MTQPENPPSRLYILADAYAERAADFRAIVRDLRRKGRHSTANDYAAWARRMEEAVAFARRGLRVVQ
jgi:hypothetical protein